MLRGVYIHIVKDGTKDRALGYAIAKGDRDSVKPEAMTEKELDDK